MNIRTLERVKEEWMFAADAMPQLICLVQRDGRVLRANRTLERWGLGQAGAVEGIELHEVLHPHCSDPDCYLRPFWQRTVAALAKEGRAECAVWDPLLKRHLEIRSNLPVQEDGGEDYFALVMIDDVTQSRASAEQSSEAARMQSLRVEHEVQKLAQARNVQSHLITILDKTPSFVAMADRSGTLFYLNPAGRTLLGLAEQEALAGLTLIECQTPEAQARLVDEALAAAERDGLWCGDSALANRDGREIKTHLTLIAHRDENGRLAGYCLMGRDLSDWVRTEEALRATQNELWRLSAQHLTIQESERRRIATDLHDGLGQTLSLVKLSIEAVARSLSTEVSGQAAAALERLGPTVKSALAELRRISMNLRPSTLDDLGILATLSWYFREFEAACPNLKLEHDISVAETEVPELLKISIFRIVQEATSNALKHAKADRIRVCLRGEGGAIELSIEDNGQGFDPAAMASSHDFGKGLGLQSMMERAELSGGHYVFQSLPGQGTTIRVHWPTPGEFERDHLALSHALFSNTASNQLPLPDSRMPERYSQCLACMKNLRSE